MAGMKLGKRTKKLKFKKRKQNPPNREIRKTKILRNKKIKEMIIIKKTMAMIHIITIIPMIITKTMIITTMDTTRNKISQTNSISLNITITEIKAFL